MAMWKMGDLYSPLEKVALIRTLCSLSTSNFVIVTEPFVTRRLKKLYG